MTKKIYTYALAASALFGSLGGGSSSAFNFLAANNNNNEEFKINSTIADDFSLFSFDPYVKYADGNMDQSIYGATLINFKPSFNDKYLSIIYAYQPPSYADERYYYVLIGASNDYGKKWGNTINTLIPLQLIDNLDNYIRLTFDIENKTFKSFKQFMNDSNELTISLTLFTTLEVIKNDATFDDPFPFFEYYMGQTGTSTFIFNKNIDAKPSELAAVSSRSTSSASGLTADDGYSSAYNLPYTINLKDPHAWSYRFDKDSELTNFWESFLGVFGGGGDELEDQLFYSFKMPLGWERYEITKVDMQYKAFYVTGSSYDVISNQDTYDYFEIDTNDLSTWTPTGASKDNSWPGASYYPLNLNDIQNITSVTDLLKFIVNLVSSEEPARTLESAKTTEKYLSMPFFEKTIEPETAQTNIGDTYYTWKKIQTAKDFKEAFSGNDELINFANQYMPTDDYIVINFDDTYYNWNDASFSFRNEDLGVVNSMPDIYIQFYNYLKNNGIEAFPDNPNLGNPFNINVMNYIQFNMIRYTDITANQLELINSNGEAVIFNTSVEPVDEENSGGESEDPIEDISNWFTDFIDNIKSYLEQPWNIVKIVIIATGLILLIAFLGWIINLFKSKK